MRLVQIDRSPACLASLALATLTPTAFGQMVWKKANPKTSPSVRYLHAMAYDSVRQRTVLFGGTSGGAETWEWDGKVWTKIKPTASPPTRFQHKIAYDSVRRVVVLFGGYDGNKVLKDTWEYDGKSWRQRSPKTKPPPLYGHAMVYDRTRRVIVVFGGNRISTNWFVSNQTWEWDGTNWQQALTKRFPPGRVHHTMSYDVARRVVVLFGGANGGPRLTDTWEWDGGNPPKFGWKKRLPAVSPPATQGRMVYDEDRHRSVWIGNRRGSGGSGVPDLWEWDGRIWRQGNGQISPWRPWPGVAYDSGRRRVVLFGGAFAPNDTWEYYPTHRGTATPVGTGCAGSAGIPSLTSEGPPIIGNQDFRIRIESANPNSPAFLGLALKPATVSMGGCTLHLDVSGGQPILIAGRSNRAGTLELPLPVPFNLALRGFRLEAQGFVHDPNGRFFGGLAFTNGLRLIFGD